MAETTMETMMETTNNSEVAVESPKQERRVMKADFTKGIFATSDNFMLAMNMAKTLAGSSIIPETFQNKWENCMIAIEQANRLNMSPIMVMQNMYIVYGRPSWSSKFLIAMINNSRKFDQPLKFREETDKDGNPYACTAWTTLNGEVIEGMKVTMDIARAEGWVSKNGSKWKTMPQLMLRYRAASFFSSLNCPEVTMGLYTSDEIIEGDYKEIPIEASVSQTVTEAQETAEEKTGTIPVEMPMEAPTAEADAPTEANKTVPEKPAKTTAKKEAPKAEEELDAGF